MKSLGKMVFAFTILLTIMAAILLILMSLTSIVYGIIDLVIGLMGASGGQRSIATLLKLLAMIALMLIIGKLFFGTAKAGLFAIGKGMGKLGLKAVRAGTPKNLISGAKNTGRNALRLASGMPNLSPKDLNTAGRFLRRYGGNTGRSIGKGLSSMSEAKKMMSKNKDGTGLKDRVLEEGDKNLAKAKGIADKAKGSIDGEKKASRLKKLEKKGDKRTDKEQKEYERLLNESKETIYGNPLDGKSDANPDAATPDEVSNEGEKEDTPEERQEKAKAAGANPEEHSKAEGEVANNDAQAKQVSQLMHAMNPALGEAMTKAGVLGIPGMLMAVQISQTLNTVVNNHLNASSAPMSPSTVFDGNAIPSSASDLPIDKAVAEIQATKSASELQALAENQHGLATGQAPNKEEQSKSLNRDAKGDALPSFANDEIAQAAETVAQHRAIAGPSVSKEVTDSDAEPTLDVIAKDKAAQEQEENYVEGMENPEVAMSDDAGVTSSIERMDNAVSVADSIAAQQQDNPQVQALIDEFREQANKGNEEALAIGDNYQSQMEQAAIDNGGTISEEQMQNIIQNAVQSMEAASSNGYSSNENAAGTDKLPVNDHEVEKPDTYTHSERVEDAALAALIATGIGRELSSSMESLGEDIKGTEFKVEFANPEEAIRKIQKAIDAHKSGDEKLLDKTVKDLQNDVNIPAEEMGGVTNVTNNISSSSSVVNNTTTGESTSSTAGMPSGDNFEDKLNSSIRNIIKNRAEFEMRKVEEKEYEESSIQSQSEGNR